MSLSRRELRTLRGIELDLAVSDPGLNEFFLSFTSRARGREMPRVESVPRGPFRIPGWLRPRRSVTERAKDRCAENWNDQ